ncbi:MAG: septation protein SpoVG family protein [Candidatus Omnitrophota bacterium]|nr:SpoVG family protein [Candidatus Omnitrophota bacterium]
MNLDFKVNKLYRFNGDGAIKAICDVAISGEFLVKGFRVIKGKNGLFVGGPREQGKDGKWYSNAFPLTASSKEALNEVVLLAYERSSNQ